MLSTLYLLLVKSTSSAQTSEGFFIESFAPANGSNNNDNGCNPRPKPPIFTSSYGAIGENIISYVLDMLNAYNQSRDNYLLTLNENINNELAQFTVPLSNASWETMIHTLETTHGITDANTLAVIESAALNSEEGVIDTAVNQFVINSSNDVNNAIKTDCLLQTPDNYNSIVANTNMVINRAILSNKGFLTLSQAGQTFLNGILPTLPQGATKECVDYVKTTCFAIATALQDELNTEYETLVDTTIPTIIKTAADVMSAEQMTALKNAEASTNQQWAILETMTTDQTPAPPSGGNVPKPSTPNAPLQTTRGMNNRGRNPALGQQMFVRPDVHARRTLGRANSITAGQDVNGVHFVPQHIEQPPYQLTREEMAEVRRTVEAENRLRNAMLRGNGGDDDDYQ